ncbi:MAG: Uncharacterised protein [Cellulomonadaceae bacterium TMED98]|nr:MAG: Uncharacterised protein [Cellulomonadaceae bacterium TMED98]
MVVVNIWLGDLHTVTRGNHPQNQSIGLDIGRESVGEGQRWSIHPVMVARGG